MFGIVAFVMGALKEIAGSFGWSDEAPARDDGSVHTPASDGAGMPADTATPHTNAGLESLPVSDGAAAANDNLLMLYGPESAQNFAQELTSGDPPSAAASSIIAAWTEAGVITVGDLGRPELFHSDGDGSGPETSLADAFNALQKANALFGGGDHDVILLETHHPLPYLDVPFA